VDQDVGLLQLDAHLVGVGHEIGGDVTAVELHEAAARLQLGGVWTDVERTAAFEPCEIAGLPEIYEQAQADEEAAKQEMIAANPMGRGITTPEELAYFTAAQEKHGKLMVRREALMGLMIAAGK
jgi:hypothetical protein